MAGLKPSEVVGVPVLPPPAASTAGSRLRARVRRLHDRMAPPPLQIIETAMSMLDHRVLVALCEVGVPDALVRPMAVADLAAAIDADPDGLGRALRFAALRGWVRFDRRGRVRPTRVTGFLRRDHPGGWREWVDFAGGDDVVGAIARFSLRRGAPPAFEAANGAAFFDWMAQHPARAAAFNGAMAAGARLHALTVNAALDWEGVTSVCDVGGGTGALARALLDLRPSLTATLLDLPEVVAAAEPHDRLTLLAGDFFAEVPSGFDVYLYVNVLHDWGDDDVRRLLSVAASAMGEGSRVVAVDSDADAWRHNVVGVSADLLMAALTNGGRERTAAEFAALAASAGLKHARTLSLASGDVAHEFVRG